MPTVMVRCGSIRCSARAAAKAAGRSSVASREHNLFHPSELEAAARYIEVTLSGLGYGTAAQRFVVDGKEVRNIEVEVAGGADAGEVVIVGAHYDSVLGAVGANDNGSGVAAVLELARLFRDARPARTVRFVTFVNESKAPYGGLKRTLLPVCEKTD